jgi:hypothetical protein
VLKAKEEHWNRRDKHGPRHQAKPLIPNNFSFLVKSVKLAALFKAEQLVARNSKAGALRLWADLTEAAGRGVWSVRLQSRPGTWCARWIEFSAC